MPAWSHETIHDLPAWTLHDAASEFAVVVLPDTAWPGDSDFDSLAALLSHRGLNAVMPQCRGAWWLDRPERGFPMETAPLRFVAERVAGWIGETWGQRPPKLGVLGVGRGGQGAMQLAYRWPQVFPVVAAISPAIDFHARQRDDPTLSDVFESQEAARQQTATLHLHPLNWPPHQWFVCDPAADWRHDGCARLASKLTSIGIPFTADLRSTNGGDAAAYVEQQLPLAAEFLAARLREVAVSAPLASRR
jgi:S-formylglutathione hydrolase